MKIHEYQAKEIFARHAIAVPRGKVAVDVDEVERAAEAIARESGDATVVVKAQIHAGGRGKAGGVKVARGGAAEARALAEAMFGRPLVTHQTGPEGQIVRRVYVEEGLSIGRELYLAIVLDRETRRPAVIASADGGMDIEEVARKTPERIARVRVDPIVGFAPYQARELAFALGLDKELVGAFVRLSASLYEVFVEEDCSLCEINPLIVTVDRKLVALDGKVNFDDNAEIRHPEWKSLRDEDEEDRVELEAKSAGLSYVSLDGDIGCLVNGAGLAMATMDIIQLEGGRPANFLDVGGGATEDQVAKAFAIILRSPKVRAIFVNIFGGIMRCDVVAAGIIAASKRLGVSVPLVVRLEGTKVEEGRKLLAESGLAIESAQGMADGARKAVAAALKGAHS